MNKKRTYYLKCAITFLENENYGAALNQFKNMVCLNIIDHYAYFNMGCCYVSLNDLDNAIFCFKKAVLVCQKYPTYFFYLGHTYFLQGYINLALNILSKFLTFKFNDNNLFKPIAYYILGIILNARSEYKAAELMFNNSLKLNSNYVLCILAKIDNYLDANDLNMAVDLIVDFDIKIHNDNINMLDDHMIRFDNLKIKMKMKNKK